MAGSISARIRSKCIYPEIGWTYIGKTIVFMSMQCMRNAGDPLLLSGLGQTKKRPVFRYDEEGSFMNTFEMKTTIHFGADAWED